MRVCRITRPPLKGITDQFPQREVHIKKHLEVRGHEVITFEIQPLKVRNIYLAYGLGALLSIFQYRRIKADVIIADNIEAAVAAACIRFLYRVPFVFDFIDDYELIAGYDAFRLRYRLIRFLEKWLPRFADAVIVVDEHKRSFCKKIGVDQEKIFLVPDGTDTERFTPHANLLERAAKVYPRNTKVVLYVGKINIYYEIEKIVRAILHVIDTTPNVKFLFVGQGDDVERSQRLSTQLGIAHAVQFTGFMPPESIPGMMAAADVCVFPLPDSSALVIFEYMACGKAVVVPDYGTEKMGISGDILPEDCIVKATNTPEGIADKIILLLENETLRIDIGQRARQFVKQDYDWSELTLKYESTLMQVLPQTA